MKYARSVLNKLNQSNYEKLNYDLTEYLNNYIENENIQIKISYQFVDTVKEKFHIIREFEKYELLV